MTLHTADGAACGSKGGPERKSISELDARSLEGRQDNGNQCAISATQMSRW
jgi:hypothetical protein